MEKILTADTTHSGLLGLLPHGELILSGVVRARHGGGVVRGGGGGQARRRGEGEGEGGGRSGRERRRRNGGYNMSGEGRRGKATVSTTQAGTDPWVWDGWGVGGKRGGGDRTHSLSRSYCECTGSLACTNWCCSSSIAVSSSSCKRAGASSTRVSAVDVQVRRHAHRNIGTIRTNLPDPMITTLLYSPLQLRLTFLLLSSYSLINPFLLFSYCLLISVTKSYRPSLLAPSAPEPL